MRTTELTGAVVVSPHPVELFVMCYFVIISIMDMSFFIHSFTIVATSIPFSLKIFSALPLYPARCK